MNRRRFLFAAVAGGTGLALFASRPNDLGRGGHDAYFLGLTKALRDGGYGRPTMIVDLDRLDANIDAVAGSIGPRALRVVAKSLPSPRLIDYVLRRADSKRVMVFHQPFVNAMMVARGDADLLLGKPMPIAAAARAYARHERGEFDPARQLEWLIDTPERLRQYRDLAAAQSLSLRVNIEIDVGLHRGGLSGPRDLAAMLDVIAADPNLEFAGLMGYDPHVVKIPGLPGTQEREFEAVKDRYRGFLAVAKERGIAIDALTRNAAGSPTYALWNEVEGNDEAGIASELSVGSAFVKPLDFDIPTLVAHTPALFIATPVLKTADELQISGIGPLNQIWSAWDPNRARTVFTYGGFWKARPVSPVGLSLNPAFGYSTNQEMLNASKRVELDVDDFVFLRPTQSEFVMLQFGDLVMVRAGEIVDVWPVFDEAGFA